MNLSKFFVSILLLLQISTAFAKSIADIPINRSDPGFGNENFFVQGATDIGGTMLLWFKASAKAHYVIVHFSIPKSLQDNRKMIYSNALDRWEYLISPIARGTTVSYFFTYSFQTGRQMDSPGYSHTAGEKDSETPTPQIMPPGGRYAEAQTVTISSEKNTIIRYTVDGSTPNSHSPVYLAPLSIARSVTISAISIREDGSESAIAQESYVISSGAGKVEKPVFSHNSGKYATKISLNMTSPTPGARIHYTKDGSEPTSASPMYNGTVYLDNVENLT
ncbi:MAG: chitobiase/beta-hexosaminidase C-terminal domain-containing protein, partial [Oligoflexales bacterium]|nr:chitobiase/beta-hexosaminidase C-terminal domain-containing protein [Oligoflexales bacterium]